MRGDCFMPHCPWEATEGIFCEHHHTLAHPSEQYLRAHIRGENAAHARANMERLYGTQLDDALKAYGK